MLVLAIVSTVVVLVTFTFTTLVDEPATAVALTLILLLSIALELGGNGSATRHEQGAIGRRIMPVWRDQPAPVNVGDMVRFYGC